MNIFGIPLEAAIGIVICFLPIIALWISAKRDTHVTQAFTNFQNRNSETTGSKGIHFNCPEGENCHPILESCHFHGKKSALTYEQV